MRLVLRVGIAGLACVSIAVAIVFWATRNVHDGQGHKVTASSPATASRSAAQSPGAPADVESEMFPDPNAPATSQVFVDPSIVEGDLFGEVAAFTAPVHDSASLKERAQAILARGPRGIAALRAESERLKLDSPPSADQALRAMHLWRSLAFLNVYEGKVGEAASWTEKALALARTPGVPDRMRADLKAFLGIIALRRGELENCVGCAGPSSCIFPIARAAIHKQPAGSREAVRQFTSYLQEWPGDLRVRWLLTIAAMTLGEYPEKVPPEFRIPLDGFRSKLNVLPFENVAMRVGLGARGPGLAGGSIFDDFTGDGLADIFATSLDADRGASLFVNRGDGSFEDRSSSAGLDEQVYALNVRSADFDNDGNLDVVLLRGGWEQPARLSLLRNKGAGVFEDVTLAAGMGEPIATEAAAWADYDNDGLVDLFVCGEYMPVVSSGEPDPRNRCRLYHNQGGGKFVDVAAAAGVLNERYAKGAAWGDYDDDGRPDLFVSNMSKLASMPCRLYHNEGNGTFRDVAFDLGVTGPLLSFPCLWWDYDNDGRLDLLASEYNSSLAEVIAGHLGLPTKPTHHPRLYRNLGPKGFRDVSREVGLTQPMPAMSINCGDIDNDGFLDLHMGTGWMALSGLVPEVTLKNDGGRRFQDITTSAGTGHLQKGHGVSFADFDGDGDLDLFVVFGGGYPGDKAYSALFQNPGAGRHWLKVKLVGAVSNRSALGARIRVDLDGPDGASRSIHRMVGTNGSFGGNSLVESIGLLDSKSVTRLTVTWPTSRTTQEFHDIAADQSIEITERADAYRVLPRSQPDSRSAPR